MRVIFVAGTDTGVGKTVVTGLLARYILEKGYSVVTQKLIQTGSKRSSGDIDVHLRFMGKEKKDFKSHMPFMLPYKFKFASSPHLAARLENKKIDIEKIKKNLEALSERFDFVIVEGIGGLLVPLDGKRLLVDVIDELRLPTLIVSANKLGAINHALLSVEALKTRRMKMLGIIFNNLLRDEDKVILDDNVDVVNRLTGRSVLGVLTFMKDPLRLQKRFEIIGDKILTLHG